MKKRYCGLFVIDVNELKPMKGKPAMLELKDHVKIKSTHICNRKIWNFLFFIKIIDIYYLHTYQRFIEFDISLTHDDLVTGVVPRILNLSMMTENA